MDWTLTPAQQKGVLDSLLSPEMQKQRQNQALLGMAAGLLEASGPSRVPVGWGQALGTGMRNMQAADDGYMDRAYKEMALGAQMREAMAGKKTDFDRTVDTYMALPDDDPRKGLYRAHIEKQNTVSPGMMGMITPYQQYQMGVQQEKDRREMESPTPVFDPNDGTLKYVPKSETGNYLPPTAAPGDAEKTSAGYAQRMTEQGEKLAEFEGQGKTGAEYWETVKEGLPFGNYLVSEDQQQIRQAQDDWIRAKLRKESGAVIGAEEMEKERKTYFPMPGDQADVIKQKTAARQTATEGMQQNAGTAYRPKQPKPADPYAKAKAAIERGADPAAVKQRLLGAGYDPARLGL